MPRQGSIGGVGGGGFGPNSARLSAIGSALSGGSGASGGGTREGFITPPTRGEVIGGPEPGDVSQQTLQSAGRIGVNAFENLQPFTSPLSGLGSRLSAPGGGVSQNVQTGLSQAGLSGIPLQTLNQGLQTGFQVNVDPITQAATQAGTQFFEQTALPQILSELAATGGADSSAVAARLAQAAGNIGTNIGIEGLRAGVGAAESAAGRRLSALNPAVASRGLELQGLSRLGGLEQQGFSNAISALGQAGGLAAQGLRTDLSGQVGQAGALNQLLSTISSPFPLIQDPSAAAAASFGGGGFPGGQIPGTAENIGQSLPANIQNILAGQAQEQQAANFLNLAQTIGAGSGNTVFSPNQAFAALGQGISGLSPIAGALGFGGGGGSASIFQPSAGGLSVPQIAQLAALFQQPQQQALAHGGVVEGPSFPPDQIRVDLTGGEGVIPVEDTQSLVDAESDQDILRVAKKIKGMLRKDLEENETPISSLGELVMELINRGGVKGGNAVEKRQEGGVTGSQQFVGPLPFGSGFDPDQPFLSEQALLQQIQERIKANQQQQFANVAEEDVEANTVDEEGILAEIREQAFKGLPTPEEFQRQRRLRDLLSSALTEMSPFNPSRPQLERRLAQTQESIIASEAEAAKREQVVQQTINNFLERKRRDELDAERIKIAREQLEQTKKRTGLEEERIGLAERGQEFREDVLKDPLKEARFIRLHPDQFDEETVKAAGEVLRSGRAEPTQADQIIDLVTDLLRQGVPASGIVEILRGRFGINVPTTGGGFAGEETIDFTALGQQLSIGADDETLKNAIRQQIIQNFQGPSIG